MSTLPINQPARIQTYFLATNTVLRNTYALLSMTLLVGLLVLEVTALL